MEEFAKRLAAYQLKGTREQHMAEEDTIQVLVLEAEEQLPGRRMAPGAGSVAARIIDVPIDAVKRSVQKVTEQVSEIVRDMPTVS